MIERSRKEVMQHMLEENISLCFMRQVSSSDSYSQVLVSEYMVDNRTFFSSKGIIQQAPLYLYHKTKPKKKASSIQFMLFEPETEYSSISSNISQEVRRLLQSYYKKPFLNPLDGDRDIRGFGSKDIFYYIYAILYSNIYRKKYAEFLKIDFPRIPFTKDYKLFIQLGKLGKRLADLHLLKLASPTGGSKSLEKTILKFPVNGSNKVEKPRFDSAQHKKGKVWINKVSINHKT